MASRVGKRGGVEAKEVCVCNKLKYFVGAVIKCGVAFIWMR